MKKSISRIGALALVAGLGLCGFSGQATAANGPDVIVGDLPDYEFWGVFNGIAAFSVGTTSCNIGTTNLRWERWNNFHPVIGQNLYRWKRVNGAGRFEMIGQSWLKHGFTALNGTICGSCSPRDNTGDTLDPTCSDPYSAGLNGDQARLGPKYQVNAYTGFYPYPVQGVPAVPSDSSAVIARRMQVRVNDITSSLNVGAAYFAEGQYVAQDDAAAGNGANNIAYRRVSVGGTNPNFTMSSFPGSTTQRQIPAIYGWGTVEQGVTYRTTRVPDEGHYTIACKSTLLADGRWHYEYALHNNNSDRSASGLELHLPGGGLPELIEISSLGFSAPFYHSGEPYSAMAWQPQRTSTGVKWQTTENYATNPNANALRWGTMHSYRFISDSPPVTNGTATVTLFKPGTVNTITFTGLVVPEPAPCIADANNDGGVDGSDVDTFFTAFESGSYDADTDRSGGVDGGDVEMFFIHWEQGC